MGKIIFLLLLLFFYTVHYVRYKAATKAESLHSKKVTETSSGRKCETLQQQHHGQRLAEAVTADPCSILDANGVLQEKRKGEICGGQALSFNKIHLRRLP